MKISILTGFIFLCFLSNAQDTAIPDLKGDKESLMKLQDKVLKREISSFTESGNFQKLKIPLIEIPLIKSGKNYSIFRKDSVEVKLVITRFNKSVHKIRFINNYALTIDNKPIWGTDGEIPKEEISEIFFKIGNDTITIPKSCYTNLYEPSLSNHENNKTVGGLRVYSSKDRSRYYITMSNSDGAGFYEATLIVINKKYARRVLDTGF